MTRRWVLWSIVSQQKKKNTPQSSCPDEKAESEAGSEPNSPIITFGPGDTIVFMPYHLNKQVEAKKPFCALAWERMESHSSEEKVRELSHTRTCG